MDIKKLLHTLHYNLHKKEVHMFSFGEHISFLPTLWGLLTCQNRVKFVHKRFPEPLFLVPCIIVIPFLLPIFIARHIFKALLERI